jgi:hypothetical protein
LKLVFFEENSTKTVPMIGRVDSCYLTRALFASAMAATLNGRRARSSVSHGYFLRVLLGPPLRNALRPQEYAA